MGGGAFFLVSMIGLWVVLETGNCGRKKESVKQWKQRENKYLLWIFDLGARKGGTPTGKQKTNRKNKKKALTGKSKTTSLRYMQMRFKAFLGFNFLC